MSDLLELHHYESKRQLFIAASEVGSIDRLQDNGTNCERTRIILKSSAVNNYTRYIFLVS